MVTPAFCREKNTSQGAKQQEERHFLKSKSSKGCGRVYLRIRVMTSLGTQVEWNMLIG